MHASSCGFAALALARSESAQTPSGAEPTTRRFLQAESALPGGLQTRAKCPVGAQGGGTLEADAEGENGGAEKGLADAAGGAGGNHCVDLPRGGRRARSFARARALAQLTRREIARRKPVVRAGASERAGARRQALGVTASSAMA